ncbi:hypothetical protein BH10ACI2_BH10ACI2_14800 [soil metagenome]
MKKDIENRTDIDRLMTAFYNRALADDVIGYIFTDVANLDLGQHLPVIGDFWETMLFRSGDYSRHGRNPLQVHGELSRKSPLQQRHFDRWFEIFVETVDRDFAGETAEFIKMRAAAIAKRMLDFVTGLDSHKVNFQDSDAVVR